MEVSGIIGVMPKTGERKKVGWSLPQSIGWFLWPAWVVALVWAYTGPDNSAQKNAARAFPVIQKRGPRKFRVDGVDRQTRLETTMYVDAASEANARAKAELEGVLVTGCAEA